MTSLKKMSSIFTDDDLILMLRIGIDKNILVFDADAKPGELTSRLLSLLRVIGGRNQPKKITDIIISDSDSFDDSIHEFNRHSLPENAVEKFLKLGGRLATLDDKKLCICLDMSKGLILNANHIILASY